MPFRTVKCLAVEIQGWMCEGGKLTLFLINPYFCKAYNKEELQKPFSCWNCLKPTSRNLWTVTYRMNSPDFPGHSLDGASLKTTCCCAASSMIDSDMLCMAEVMATPWPDNVLCCSMCLTSNPWVTQIAPIPTIRKPGNLVIQLRADYFIQSTGTSTKT